MDCDDLRVQIEKYADRPLKIATFSAASNVAGIVSDTAAISTLLHEHGARCPTCPTCPLTRAT